MIKPKYRLYIEHVSFTTRDGVILYGLRYSLNNYSHKIAIYIHGAGSTSIIKNPNLNNELANQLSLSGVDLLMFDNSGAGYISKLRTVDNDDKHEARFGGMAYETIKSSLADIDGAIKWANSSGYKAIYLIGHSTGANKLCAFLSAKTRPSNVAKVFLLAGGDDIALQRQRYEENNLDYQQILKTANQNNADELVPIKDFPGDHPISYKSLAELLTKYSDYDSFPFSDYLKNPKDKQLFRQFKAIDLPIIVIYGSSDFGTIIEPSKAIDLLTKINRHAKGYLIKDADHNFKNHEKTLAKIIATEL